MSTAPRTMLSSAPRMVEGVGKLRADAGRHALKPNLERIQVAVAFECANLAVGNQSQLVKHDAVAADAECLDAEIGLHVLGEQPIRQIRQSVGGITPPFDTPIGMYWIFGDQTGVVAVGAD